MKTDRTLLLSRRALIACGAMAIVGLGCAARRQTPQSPMIAGRLDRLVPRQFGAWRSLPSQDIVLPDPDDQRAVAAAYEDVAMRSFVGERGPPVMLVIARGRVGSGLLALHRPETCYRAQGFSIVDDGSEPLPVPFDALRVRRLFAARPDRHEAILYWAATGGRQSGVGVEQGLDLIKSVWAGRGTDSYLVRISASGDDSPQIIAMLRRFTVELLAVLSAGLRTSIGADPASLAGFPSSAQPAASRGALVGI
jgi:EpsI family protein